MWHPWHRTPTPPPTWSRHPSPRQSARHQPGRPRRRTPRILRTQGSPLVVRLPPIAIKLDWAQRLTAIGTVVSSLSVLALGAGLYYTNGDNREQRQLQIQAQVSDRLAKNVEQLGSSQLTTTLGGIYGLERLMRDSPADQRTVIDVLAAYVRDASKRRPKTSPTPAPPSTELQAALTVLGRQSKDNYYYWQPDLSRVDLSRVDLSGADLGDANLRDANLRGADLRDTDLFGADLFGADLRDVDLRGADLRGVDLFGVDLRGADMFGVDLRDVDLSRADLRGARSDQDTKLPTGVTIPSATSPHPTET